MLAALGFGALALLLVVLLLLAVPLRVAFRVEGIEPVRVRVTFGWLFGLLRRRFVRPAEARSAREGRRAAVRRAPKARARRSGGGARTLALLRDAEFRARALRLLRDVVAAAHPRHLRLRLRIGLGDPADTGRLWAIVGPVGLLLRQRTGSALRIEPEFVDAVLEFRAAGSLRVVPLQIVGLALGFVLSPTSIGAWRRLRAADG